MAVELYKHNKFAYEQVKSMFQTQQKCCVVHATGTGKSFIALALVYDFLMENPDSKVMLLAPLNGIGSQIKEHIATMDLPDGAFNNLQFNLYQSLVAKTEQELEQMDFDLLVLDEFHHIGAPEWTKRLEMIINANPEAKIFGMSATSVRAFGTKHEEDVAETFFEGNVASRYDLAQAILDGTLPQPNYHCALAVLEGDCAELERKINNGGASPEEKQKYQKMLTDIRKKIAEGDTSEEIIRNNIKGDGKYIYFCPKGSDISALQDNIKSMLPPEYLGNIEFYQVHSSEQTDKVNELNANSFYHNKTIDGNDAHGKLRIMFAIDMYNEGIHVPDIDGVIMGRATKSDITFYQQLGRALAVRKKDDGSDERVQPPLVIDLMGNLKEIKKLYNRVETRKNSSEREKKDHTPSDGFGTRDSFDVNFGLDEEIINLLDTLEELKANVEFTLSFDERLKELYDYLKTNGSLPKWDDNETKFTDGRIMSNWLTQKRMSINKLAEQGNEMAITISNQFRANPDELFLLHLEEAVAYCKKHGGFPNYDSSDTFSTGTVIYHWSKFNKDKIQQFAVEGNELAKKLIVYYAPTLDEAFELHINEMYDFIQANGSLPKKSLNLKFSDGKLMSAWLNKNKKKIAQAGIDGHGKAKVITEYQQKSSKTNGKSIRTLERIREIIDFYNRTGKLPSDGDKFESGAEMSLWLKAKPNKDAIQELIEQNNPEALKLIEIQNMFTSDAIFERKLLEVYDYLRTHTKIPSTGEVKFSDGTDMYAWVLSNKQKLIELSQKDNAMVLEIIDKQYDSNVFSGNYADLYDARIKELLNFYKENGRMPNSSDKVRLSDGRLMFSWMKDNMGSVQQKGQDGDELSKIAYELIYRSTDKGRFEIKCSELLKYLSEGKSFPTREDGKFSDGSSMYHFINNKVKKIYESKDENPIIERLAQLLLANNPNYFNKVKAFKQAEETFNAGSEFKKLKNSKGVKKSNGK